MIIELFLHYLQEKYRQKLYIIYKDLEYIYQNYLIYEDKPYIGSSLTKDPLKSLIKKQKELYHNYNIRNYIFLVKN